jgi:hypothetical protein
MTTPTRRYSADVVLAVAELIGLSVGPERALPLADELTAMHADLDRLAGVRLGETPPATAFDARWE